MIDNIKRVLQYCYFEEKGHYMSEMFEEHFHLFSTFNSVEERIRYIELLKDTHYIYYTLLKLMQELKLEETDL